MPRKSKKSREKSASPSRKTSRSRSRSPPKTPKKDSDDAALKKKERDPLMSTGSGSGESSWRVVDFSGQGITALPSNLFSKLEVHELLINGNNIRSLPVELSRLRNLTKMDISRNGIRCNSANDYGGMPPELDQLIMLEELNASECNFRYVPPVVWRLKSLLHLNISRNKINILQPEIGNLYRLKYLNLKETNIVTLPPEIVYCEDLEELILWGNVLESLPDTMVELSKVKSLAMNCRTFSYTVDSYMENLLQSGQIQSEHTPSVIFEMQSLEKVDLEKCKINNIPKNCDMPYLKELNLNNNFFRNFPEAALTMISLTALDLSFNALAAVPESISQLEELEILKLKDNAIQIIPKCVPKMKKLKILEMSGNQLKLIPNDIGKLQNLQKLYLGRNDITVLPDSICDLKELNTLDMTANKLTAVPMNLHRLENIRSAHAFEHLEKHGLWLHKNKVTQPPEEIWKTNNPEKIFNYLKRLQIMKTEHLQRLKVCVIGSYQAGKTSLIRALVSGKSDLTEPEVDTTPVIEETKMTTENDVKFCFNELGGADVYQATHRIFLDSKALILLVYDHSVATDENFQHQIGGWLDIIQTHIPGSVVKLIGTKIDLIEEEPEVIPEPEPEEPHFDFETPDDEKLKEEPKEEIPVKITKKQQIAIEVETKVQKYLEDIKISNEEKKIRLKEELSKSTMVSMKQIEIELQRIEHNLQNPIRVQPGIQLVSAEDSPIGTESLTGEMEILAVDKSLFPHAQRHIPQHWLNLRSAIKQIRAFSVTLEEVIEIAKTQNIFSEKDVFFALRFFRDTGDILWFDKSPRLSEIVYHVPTRLAELLGALFKHDLYEYLVYDNRVWRSRGKYTEDGFNMTKQDLLTNGILTRPLITCLWFYQKIPFYDFEDVLDILPHLDFAFTIPTTDVPTQTSYHEPMGVIPWFSKDPCGNEISESWAEAALSGMELKLDFTILATAISGLYERLVIRLQEHIDTRVDWCDGTIAFFEDGCLSLIKTQNKGNPVYTLRVISESFENLENKLYSIYSEFKDVFQLYPGLAWFATYTSDSCDKGQLMKIVEKLDNAKLGCEHDFSE